LSRLIGNIYKRLQKDLQPVQSGRPSLSLSLSLPPSRVNSDAQTTCTPNQKHANCLFDVWHIVCFIRGSVEEWDVGLGQPAGGCITAAATGTASSR